MDSIQNRDPCTSWTALKLLSILSCFLSYSPLLLYFLPRNKHSKRETSWISKIQNPKSKIQHPKSKIQNPKSKNQNPKSKIQKSKSKIWLRIPEAQSGFLFPLQWGLPVAAKRPLCAVFATLVVPGAPVMSRSCEVPLRVANLQLFLVPHPFTLLLFSAQTAHTHKSSSSVQSSKIALFACAIHTYATLNDLIFDYLPNFLPGNLFCHQSDRRPPATVAFSLAASKGEPKRQGSDWPTPLRPEPCRSKLPGFVAGFVAHQLWPSLVAWARRNLILLACNVFP
jgi:hypothetical protein